MGKERTKRGRKDWKNHPSEIYFLVTALARAASSQQPTRPHALYHRSSFSNDEQLSYSRELNSQQFGPREQTYENIVGGAGGCGGALINSIRTKGWLSGCGKGSQILVG